MAISEFLVELAVAVVAACSQAAHLYETIRNSTEGRKHHREMIAGGIVFLKYVDDATYSVGLGNGGATEFEDFHR